MSRVRIPSSGRMIGGSSAVERLQCEKKMSLEILQSCSSVGLEHSPDKGKVVGSNPIRTIQTK